MLHSHNALGVTTCDGRGRRDPLHLWLRLRLERVHDPMGIMAGRPSDGRGRGPVPGRLRMD